MPRYTETHRTRAGSKGRGMAGIYPGRKIFRINNNNKKSSEVFSPKFLFYYIPWVLEFRLCMGHKPIGLIVYRMLNKCSKIIRYVVDKWIFKFN